MDIPFLKHELVRHKLFFKQLFNNSPRRNSSFIEKASDKELKILIKVLHLICIGKISIRNEDFKSLKQSKRLHAFKKTFETKKAFITLLKETKIQKICVLKKFSAIYSTILHTMFNRI